MTRPCPNCNELNPPDAAFCRNCAASLAPTPAPPHIGARPNDPWQPPAQPPMMNKSQTATGASQRAMAALGMAIAGLLCCGPFLAIPAAIVGWLELDAINNGRSDQAGKWMAQVGLWGGIAATIIHTVLFAIWIIFSMLAGGGY